MRQLEDQLSFDPVYFVKPGDTLERAARNILGYGAGRTDIDSTMRELTQLNPRLDKPSYRRMGNLLLPGQILSLAVPEFADFDAIRAGTSDRLIQYQLAREEGILGMDPRLRERYEQHSSSSDPSWQRYFAHTAYVASIRALQMLPKALGEGAVATVHHLPHVLNVHKLTHGAGSMHILLDRGAQLARSGSLGLSDFRADFKALADAFSTAAAGRMERAAEEALSLARQQMKGVVRLQKTMSKPSAVLPRVGRRFENSAHAFAPIKNIKILEYISWAAVGYEVYERLHHGFESNDRVKSIGFQIAAFAGQKAATNVIVGYACTIGSGPFAPLGVVMCPILINAGTTIAWSLLEQIIETYLVESHHQPRLELR